MIELLWTGNDNRALKHLEMTYRRVQFQVCWDYLQKTTPPKTLDITIVSAISQKCRYVDVITTVIKVQISYFEYHLKGKKSTESSGKQKGQPPSVDSHIF